MRSRVVAISKNMSLCHKKMASYLHHTATTIYPCCVPALGDSTGAGCVGLATAKIRPFKASASNFSNHFAFLSRI